MTKTTGNFTDFLDFSRASTATYLGSDGLIKTASNNVPRVEYDADGNVKGLLIEEQRTNVVAYSEDTSQWSEDGTATITNSTQIAPDGTASATLVDIGSTGSSLGPNRISRFSSGLSASTKATVSVFLKKPDTDAASHVNVRLYCSGTTATDMYVDYDTSDFTSVNSSGVVDTIHASEDYGNGWFRVSFTATLDASATGANNIRIGGVVSGSHPSTGTDFIMWGAQVETGSFPTSYIPTSGATATRSADIASIDVSNFGYNQSEGTVVVDYQGLTATPNANVRILEISDGTNNNRLTLFYNATTDTVNLFSVADGDFNLTGSVSISDPNRQGIVAGAYSPDGIFLCKDGGAVSSDTSIPTLKGLDTVNIGLSYGLNDQLNGHIKSFQYYPRRLTNAQLQELTS